MSVKAEKQKKTMYLYGKNTKLNITFSLLLKQWKNLCSFRFCQIIIMIIVIGIYCVHDFRFFLFQCEKKVLHWEKYIFFVGNLILFLCCRLIVLIKI